MFGAQCTPSQVFTPDVPGVGGSIKQRAEDFLVEELPAYEPCGSGEHLYLFVEKRNVSARQLIRLLAAHFGVRRDAVGVAGLKDRLAVTRQLVSIHTPGKSPADFRAFEHPNISVLWIDRHTNKLRRGHLRGNGFVIRIRDIDPGKAVHAARTLRILERRGVPNRIGPQRFGLLGTNHLVGRALVRADAPDALAHLLGPVPEGQWCPEPQIHARSLFAAGDFAGALASMPEGQFAERRVLAALADGANPKTALRRLERFEHAFYITAFQSALFNRVLDDRLRAGTFDRLLPGDLAFRHNNGAVFAITEESLASSADDAPVPRAARLEISPSGPMWGAEMTRASCEVGRLESEVLTQAGVSDADLARVRRNFGDSVEGKRRPLRVPVTNIDVEGGMDEHGGYVKLKFELPRGSFATSVLQEVMKVPLSLSASADAAHSDAAEDSE